MRLPHPRDVTSPSPLVCRASDQVENLEFPHVFNEHSEKLTIDCTNGIQATVYEMTFHMLSKSIIRASCAFKCASPPESPSSSLGLSLPWYDMQSTAAS